LNFLQSYKHLWHPLATPFNWDAHPNNTNTMNHCLAPTYDCHTKSKDHSLKHKIKVDLKESKDNSKFELDWKFTKESKHEKIKSKGSSICKALTICKEGG
jgi:hypothetical protein